MTTAPRPVTILNKNARQVLKASQFMLLLILVVVIALVAWALRLMEQAIQSQEFSLMLAGFLVASSAAAMMAVYFLMNHYVAYMGHTTVAFLVAR